MASEEDCKEEQISELEALESIYPDELTITETEPYHVFSVSLRSQETNDQDKEQDAVFCTLNFSFTKLYPHELPEMDIETETLDESRVEELQQLMSSLGEENMGMPMVFTMVAAVIDKLNEYSDTNTTDREEAAERAIREAEEAERKKFEGTRCTVENFMAWKLKFDAEREEELKTRKLKEVDSNKPTGYELFMRDKTLDESDLTLLDTDDIGKVDVDESLFEDMDDLELEEELT